MYKVYIVKKCWVDDPYLATYEDIMLVTKSEKTAKEFCSLCKEKAQARIEEYYDCWFKYEEYNVED
jgi:hypothetical protein